MSNETITDKVRKTCATWTATTGTKHVTIKQDAMLPCIEMVLKQQQVQWDEEDWHYSCPTNWPETIRKERMAAYILALDAINFCFWPSTDQYEYEDLAVSLKHIAASDHAQLEDQGFTDESQESNFLLSATSLREITVEKMTKLFQQYHSNNKVPPDMEKRCALWNEVGKVILEEFEGSFSNLLKRGNGSAVQLVQVLVDYFPGFRDYCSLGECTIYLLKRAQICVGDWNASLQLNLPDISKLTMFADYRVPQLLRHWGVLEYSLDLAEKIDQKVELEPNGEEEVSIRTATVTTVELIVEGLQRRVREQDGSHHDKWNSVMVDWYLWQLGEEMQAKRELKPHHSVRTIFY